MWAEKEQLIPGPVSREDQRGTVLGWVHLLIVLNQLSWAMNRSVGKRFLLSACSSALSNFQGLMDHEYDPGWLSEQNQRSFM